MTTFQIILFTFLYFVAFVAAIYFTRAKVRRIAGAVAGGAVFGYVGLLGAKLGEAQNWWVIPEANASHFQLLFWVGLSVSVAPVYLITWRVARRWGGRGLAVCTLISALIGPPRDYTYARTFPKWMTFSPGIAPVLADAALYALLVIVGHAVMRIVAGPAGGDGLARAGQNDHAPSN